MNIKNFNIGSMMMIPKTKNVSKFYQKMSTVLHKERSNIVGKGKKS